MNKNVPNYNPSANSKDIFTALRQIVKTYLNDFMFTAEPVMIQSVNNDGSLNLLPVIDDITTLGEKITNTTNDLVKNIMPLYFVGGFNEISFNLKIGDFGLLIACKKDISNFVKNHTESEIGSKRQFSLSNGFFLPMDFFNAKKTNLTIKRQNDNVSSTIVLDDTGIVISTNKDIKINVTGNVEETINGNLTQTVKGKTTQTITGDAEITAKNIKATGQQNVEITATNATIKSANINLGGTGGKTVALNGDPVISGGVVVGNIQSTCTTTKAL